MTTVLVVDDHEESLYLSQQVLALSGYTVLTAINGAQALEVARACVPDLLITDILMPVMDGFALCQAWKADTHLQRVPLVFYTATYTDAQDERLAMEMGADAFWVKPVEPDELLARVQALLARTEAAGGARAAPEVSEPTVLRLYNQVLVHKLEDKLQQLEESHQFTRMLFEHSPTGLVLSHPDGTVVEANGTYARMLGMNVGQVLGSSLWQADGDRWAEVEALQRQSLTQTGVYGPYEKQVLHAQGHRVWVRLAGTVVERDGAQWVWSSVEDITATMLAQNQLADSEFRLQEAQRYARIGYWELNRDGQTALWSPEVYNMLGLTADAVPGPELLCHLVVPGDCGPVLDSLRKSLTDGTEHHMEYRILRQSDGEERWMSCRGRPILGEDGRPERLQGFIQDITERKRAEEGLRLAASVFANSREAIMIAGLDARIMDVNAAFTSITGYSHADVVGQNPRLLNSGRQDREFYVSLWTSLLSKGHWYGEVWNRRKNGEIYAELMTISTVRDGSGQPLHYVALFSDITTLKAHESRLQHVAHFDPLTNLPNRSLLADRMQLAMNQALRHQHLLALAYLDLDGLKHVNDTHGHGVGDELLIAVADRMRQTMRDGDTLARIGGDEFVLLMPELDDESAIAPVMLRLLAAVSEPVVVADKSLRVSASVGVVFFPQGEEVDADQLLRQADHAMYQAKQAGKNRYTVFDSEEARNVRSRYEGLGRLAHALAEGEFVLHYQPKVNMRSGNVVGAEALIRWQHPEQGLLMPGSFLPQMEDHPLAVEVGEWVIATALEQLTLWRAQGLDIPVSVNVGARQLQQVNFVERLTGILAKAPHFSPGDLQLEVLETSALADLAHVSKVIEGCRHLGVTFALDDFGTGYSSLTYLKRLAVVQIKIDQSFVHDMLDDADDRAILEGTIGLAHAFQRSVIAEGVETVAHGELLLRLGCFLGQGYGIARPMPAAEVPAWALSWQPDASWQM